jgi:hypothetical protein
LRHIFSFHLQLLRINSRPRGKGQYDRQWRDPCTGRLSIATLEPNGIAAGITLGMKIRFARIGTATFKTAIAAG